MRPRRWQPTADGGRTMDCKTARLLLAFSRTQASELDTSDADALDNHLAECPECEALAHAERQMERQLSQAMRQVAVPSNLRQRLLTRLQAERSPWYRRLPQRHPPVAAAVSALALSVIGLG